MIKILCLIELLTLVLLVKVTVKEKLNLFERCYLFVSIISCTIFSNFLASISYPLGMYFIGLVIGTSMVVMTISKSFNKRRVVYASTRKNKNRREGISTLLINEKRRC